MGTNTPPPLSVLLHFLCVFVDGAVAVLQTHKTTAHYSTLGLPISDEIGPREVGRSSGCCSNMTLALHGRVLAYIFRFSSVLC